MKTNVCGRKKRSKGNRTTGAINPRFLLSSAFDAFSSHPRSMPRIMYNFFIFLKVCIHHLFCVCGLRVFNRNSFLLIC